MSTVSERSRSENWYEVLGISPDASDAEIGRAFRRLAREFHPDVTAERSSTSDAHFDRIARAYEVLGDPTRRADYDRARAEPPGRSRPTRIPVRNRSSATPGQPRPRAVGTPDGAHDEHPGPTEDLAVTFAEALTGTTRRVHLLTEGQCDACRGAGTTEPGACAHCGGAGRVDRSAGAIAIHHVCDHCHGTGRAPAATCTRCGGTGLVRAVRAVTVRVPAGIRDGTRLRIRPAAAAALEAVVRVEPDERLRREGDDILFELPLTFAEAALGTTVTTESPLGGSLEVVIPPGTPFGRRLEVASHLRAPLRLVASITITVPSELSQAERQALEAFGRATRSPRLTDRQGDLRAP